MSEKVMQKLAADDVIPEVENLHLGKCADCLAGKQNRTSFRSRPPMRWKALLELVHTDVCYVDTKSHSGGQYFVTFIDDHSRKLWTYILEEEMDSLHENHTDELTELPRGKKALRNKWVYKRKPGERRNPPRYKAKIVVKGFQQKKRVNFDEIFAPVVKMTSIQTVLSIATSMDLEVEQLYVKMAFLHEDLEEEIYM